MRKATGLRAYSGLVLAFLIPFLATQVVIGNVFYSGLIGAFVLILAMYMSSLFGNKDKDDNGKDDLDYRTIKFSELNNVYLKERRSGQDE